MTESQPAEEVVATAPRRASRRWTRALAAVLAGVAAAGLLNASGSLSAVDAALQAMGFDPDRAHLLTALTLAALVASAGALVAAAPASSALVGILAGAALFAGTFWDETTAATAGNSALGPFDPAGWLVSLVTVIVALAIAAWAATALTSIVRRTVLRALDDTVAFARGDRRSGRIARPAAVVAWLALFVVVVPVFGDMVNYEPDVHMNGGQVASAQAALAAGDSGLGQSQGQGGDPAAASAGDLPTPTVMVQPGDANGQNTATGGSASPSPVLSSARPWMAWRPAGTGTVTTVVLPAPWTGVSQRTETLDIYLPAGYSASSQSYPVIYAVPWGISGGWTTGVNVRGQLDALIASGAMPASIVVFVPESGGPFADSECANSVDGREMMDTFIAQTVVDHIDASYRTIANARGRTIMGFSQGGFCAASLALRHPDVFATAVSISGYFQAAVVSSQTPNAWRPFANNAAAIAAYSPLKLVGAIPASLRSQLLLVIQGSPTEPFYGPQYAAMAAAARQAGVSTALLPSGYGHSWRAVGAVLPALLKLVGQHEAALGAFG